MISCCRNLKLRQTHCFVGLHAKEFNISVNRAWKCYDMYAEAILFQFARLVIVCTLISQQQEKSKFYLKFFPAQKQHEMRNCSITNLFAIFERHASFYVNWNRKKCPHFKIQPSFVSTNLHHIFSIFYFERVQPTKTKHVYLSFASCGHPSQIKPVRVHKLRCNLQRWYHQSL